MIRRGNESQDVHVSTRVGVSGARHGGRIPKRMDVAVVDAGYRPVLSWSAEEEGRNVSLLVPKKGRITVFGPQLL